MPHCKPEDLPDDRWPLMHVNGRSGFRSAQWGDMEVGFTQTGPYDATHLYQGVLAGGVCPCPHYGYIFSGRIRAHWPGTDWPDEVAEAGEVYFFPASHVLIYEEDTRALELNPAHALQTCMDGMQRAVERGHFAALQAGEHADAK